MVTQQRVVVDEEDYEKKEKQNQIMLENKQIKTNQFSIKGQGLKLTKRFF